MKLSYVNLLFKLHSIRDFYIEEAERCYESKAFLAACIMLGAVLEASLLIMVESYPDKVNNSKRVPKYKNGKIKPTAKWKLIELLNIADDLNWLPRTKEYEEIKCEIGDMGDVIRTIRNHIHPAHYLSKYPLILTKDHYIAMYKILKIINELLSNKVKDNLVQHLT
jgi:hypothetical protein